MLAARLEDLMKKYKRTSDIKVGVVGYGGAYNMGRVHLQEMQKAGMTPTAVTEIDPARLAAATEDFRGIETYSSLPAMLKKSAVDLVTIINAAQHPRPARASRPEGGAARGLRKADGDQDRGM